MKWVRRILLAALLIYLAVMAFIYVKQRAFMYFPDTSPPPAALRDQGVRGVYLEPENMDVHLTALYSPPPTADAPVILFFHGNGGAAYNRQAQMRDFKAWGFGLLAVEYPGYGGNPGTPNETDILATALAGYDWLVAQGVKPKQIFVFGHSLGTASATYVAAKRDAAGLVLTSPFTSTKAMARLSMPYLPTGLLLKDTFRSDLWMVDVEEPLLIIHGDADREVPYAMGKALLTKHKGRHEFVTIKGGGHYLWSTEAPEVLRQFVLAQSNG